MAYYGTVTLVSENLSANSVERAYWGLSSSASSTGGGTTGLWWSATYIDLLGQGANTSSSSFDHITAPDSTERLHYYDVSFAVHTPISSDSTGELYMQRWPVGATADTCRSILSTGSDIVNNKLYQFTIPVSGGEEFTIGISAAASTAQYSLFIEPSRGNVITKL